MDLETQGQGEKENTILKNQNPDMALSFPASGTFWVVGSKAEMAKSRTAPHITSSKMTQK